MRVMAAVDLGPACGRVARMSAELAGPRGFVMFAHVANPDWTEPDAAARTIREAGEAIQRLVDEHGIARFTVHIERLRGDEPGHALARMARDLEADIVVVGAGTSPRGHTTGVIVRDVPCTVVVLRSPSAETLAGLLTWRT